MKIKGNFKAWFENDEYFFKKGFFSRKKRISKDEFLKIAESNNITEASVTKVNTGLIDLYNNFKRNVNEDRSEFDNRVTVEIINEHYETGSADGSFNVAVKLKISDENNPQNVHHYAEISYEDLKGIKSDSISSAPELIRSLHQLMYNGALHNEEELIVVDEMVAKTIIVRD